MDNDENRVELMIDALQAHGRQVNITQASHVSHLRPPSKYAATPGRSLYEISESDYNARSAAMLPPPSTVSLKHKPSGLPEPAAKRKTLAERAGEVPPSNIAAPNSRSFAPQAQTGSSQYPRNSSYSSSASTRSHSSSSRKTSGASFSSSHGGMSKSGSGHYRPQSAYGTRRSGMLPPTGISRPQTALETHYEDSREDVRPGKRKGVVPFSSSSPDCPHISVRRQRERDNYRSDPIYTRSQTDASTTSAGGKMNPFRELSITTQMQQLRINSDATASDAAPAASVDVKTPSTPSFIPRITRTPVSTSAKSTASRRKQGKSVTPSKPKLRNIYMSKWSNVLAADDVRDSIEGRFNRFEQSISSWMAEMETASKNGQNNLQELMAQVEIYKTKLNELESMRMQLSVSNASLQTELDGTKSRLASANADLERAQRNHSSALEETKRSHSNDLEEAKRKHRNELEDIRDQQRRECERLTNKSQDEADKIIKQHRDELADLEKRLKGQLEDEKDQRLREVQEISKQLALQRQNAEIDAGNKDRETKNMKMDIERREADLDQEKSLTTSLKNKLSVAAAERTALEAELQAIKDKAMFLESDSQAQSQAFADLHRQTQEAIQAAAEANAKLRAEETLRRKLHNQVQELKGNIRVFCRVRPMLNADEDDAAKVSFPDCGDESKELVVMGPEHKSALGNITTSKNAFSFDRVFGPPSKNSEIFEEISQLVQSALDGYNVCIFCYGQTGSGKTHTMSSPDGMIPLAVSQIYQTAKDLEEKGWKYKMEGSFVEVYNENLNDLLGKAEEIDKKKHEIRHEKGKTTITEVNSMMLDSPETLSCLLDRASANRSVAATKANERSSRSHSVFILKLTGENSITGEKSEGNLNLVDLAGSERLNQSGATGDRLKETQNINRSLSCLGDVISALGQGKEGGHIPYRNSKLTYLLQNSLGGNSKTLMFVMVSPLQAHLSETLTSLKFATKVHNTHIGTAKRQTKVRDTA